MRYEVIRPFGGPEGPMPPGTLLEEAAFRPANLRRLIERRFVRPAAVAPDPAVTMTAGTAGNRAERRHGHG